MQKHFSHILKRLISPNIKAQHQGGFIKRYFKNRRNFKYCKQIFPNFNQQNITTQAVNLCRGLKFAIKDHDKVQLLRVCSIPLYQKIKSQLRTIRLGQEGINFRLLNLYRISQNQETNEKEQLDLLSKKMQWIRVQFTFKQEQKGRLVDRNLLIQRKVDQQSQHIQKKWYIYDLQAF